MSDLFKTLGDAMSPSNLDKEMLHIFDSKKSKRSKYQVKFYVENDPRTHYETVFNEEGE